MACGEKGRAISGKLNEVNDGFFAAGRETGNPGSKRGLGACVYRAVGCVFRKERLWVGGSRILPQTTQPSDASLGPTGRPPVAMWRWVPARLESGACRPR